MSDETIKRVYELFSAFRERRRKDRPKTGKLKFQGVAGQDVYNITAPFRSAGKSVIAGRVEPRDQEYSTVVFFEEIDGIWTPIAGAPVYDLQDPFVTTIHHDLVFGGVKIQDTPAGLEWRTVLYRGPDIFNLTACFQGPAGMKDIRLCDLQNDRIAVFTRPQGEVGGRGTIGYVEIDRLEDLTVAVIESATLLRDMFHPMDWGGVNEAHVLANGDIGVLAHAACFENDCPTQERHYYASAFIFNPALGKIRDYKIIASRDQFEAGPAKRTDLGDVIFSSGLSRAGGRVTLYAGVSDAEAHWIEIDDPFAATM